MIRHECMQDADRPRLGARLRMPNEGFVRGGVFGIPETIGYADVADEPLVGDETDLQRLKRIAATLKNKWVLRQEMCQPGVKRGGPFENSPFFVPDSMNRHG